MSGDEAKRLSGWYSDGQHSVGTRIYAGQLALDGPETAGMIRKAGNRYLIDDAQTLDDRLSFAPDGAWLELDGVGYTRKLQAEPPLPEAGFAALIGQ